MKLKTKNNLLRVLLRVTCSMLREKRGFTLNELLVVIAIMGILSAVIALNYRTGGEQLKLHRAANKLAQDIRRASEMAMSAKECDICGGIIPEGGYGIYFWANTWPNPTEYTALIYADTSVTPPQNSERYNSGDAIIENLSLEQGVKIRRVRDTGFGGNRRYFCANFKPPSPKVNLMRWTNLMNLTSLTGEMEITLSLINDPTKTKIIKVNTAGLIYVE